MTLPVVVMVVAASLLWGLLLITRRPSIIVVIAFLVAFVAQTRWGLRNELVSRIPVLLLGAVAAALVFGRRARRRADAARSPVLVAVAAVALLALTIYPSTSAPTTIQALGAALGTMVIGVVLGVRSSPKVVLDRLAVASGAVVVAGIGAAFVLESAWLANRLSGIFRNPNTMGVAILIAVISVPRRWLVRSLVVLIPALVATGSRASSLAVLVVLLLRVEWRPSNRVRVLFVTPLIAAVALLFGAAAVREPVSTVARAEALDPADVVADSEADGPSLLRTTDNRTGQWEQGWADFKDGVPLGRGFGTADFEYSNGVLYLLVEAGMLAVPVLILLGSVVLDATRHPDRRVRAMAAGMFVHSMFEGWLFAFGSVQALAFWITVFAAAAQLRAAQPDLPSVAVDGHTVGPMVPATGNHEPVLRGVR